MNSFGYFTLFNGIKIPAIGFGTARILNGEDAYRSVLFAMKIGYRLIDTAHAYGNEKSIGQAVRGCGIERSEIFVTSKLPAEIKTYRGTTNSFDRTLRNLDLDYLDLYLIHAPRPWLNNKKDFTKENILVWKAMEEIYNSKRCRAIGVSNFDVSDLSSIINNCSVVPMVNQIKFYIGHAQEDITHFCQSKNILVEGYSPLATGALLENDNIKTVAQKYNKTISQICIRYILQKGVLPLPKSKHPEYILKNLDMDFEISDEDMKFLDALQNTIRIIPSDNNYVNLINGFKRTFMTLLGPENYISLKNTIRSLKRPCK